MALSPSQLGSLAYQAGFRGSALTMAVAVALAESGGNPSAYNPESAAGTPPGQGSYGLWQIYRNAHPEFSSVDLYDPASNAMAAYSVYRAAGGNFTPWSTYNNGSAAQYASQLQGLGYTTGGGSGGGTGGYPSGGGSGSGTSGGGSSYPAAGGGFDTTVTTMTTETTTGAGAATGSGGGGGLINVNLLPPNVTNFLASPTTGSRLVVGAIGFVLVIFGLLMLAGAAGTAYTQNVQIPVAKATLATAKTGGLI